MALEGYRAKLYAYHSEERKEGLDLSMDSEGSSDTERRIIRPWSCREAKERRANRLQNGDHGMWMDENPPAN